MTEGGTGASATGGGRGRRIAADHPGGTGAVLGVRLLRYSGVQGITVALAAVLQLATLFVIASFLGAGELGRYSLLFFLAALINQVVTIGTKPGVIRRTFGASDDEEGDDEDDEGADVTSATPERTLGVGLVWTALLSTAAAGIVFLLREPLGEVLFSGPGGAELVAWAGLLGGATAFMRVAAIVLWFERRPAAYVVGETSRVVLALAGVTAMLATGSGLEGAIAGAALGTLASCALGVGLLWGSFVFAVDIPETLRIIARGGPRGPILSSFWVIQNADVFVLSRFVGDADLGVYMLISRLGFVGSFLPSGFRMALRPLRKAAIFKAVEDQYGRAIQRGQILGYFTLLCISAILLMVVLGGVMVELAPEPFSDFAPLIPLAAAGMVAPALLRTVNQQVSWPGKRQRVFILTTVGAALAFIAVTALLAPSIGIYAAPVGMIAAVIGPAVAYFVRGQRSERRIAFPYAEVGTAAAVATAIGLGFNLLPDVPLGVEIAIAVLALGAYAVLLFALRVIPEYHWPALAHMARSVVAGRPDRFDPRKGIGALDVDERAELRAAVVERVDPDRLAGPRGDRDAAARLVVALRRAGRNGGLSVRPRSEHDAEIASFLFAASPTAVRNATMRRLIAAGAASGELRALEDLVGHLRTVPAELWETLPLDLERSRRRARARSSSPPSA